MKFLNNLYQVSTINKDAAPQYAVTQFNPNHGLYKAHFLGNPITPGVVLLQIAKIMLENITGKHLRLTEVEHIKFNKSVGPDATAKITFMKLVQTDASLRANIKIEVEDIVYARMSLIYNNRLHSEISE